MRKLFICISLCINLIYLSGCSRDEIITPAPEVPNTSKGAYVLSEGGFTPGTSKLSFFNRTKDSFYVSIFKPGSLGLSPDGMILNDNNIYLSEQGNFGSAGKVYTTDTNGTIIRSSPVGTNPYSLAEANNKLYLTNGPAGTVSVINKGTFAAITTITVGLYPQEILSIGNKVFVCNTSLFSGEYDSTVTVIDAVADVVVATIIVRKAPCALALTNDGKLLVGCPGDVSKSVIYKIDPNNYAKLDSFTNLNFGLSKDIAVGNSNTIYFIGGDIYAEAGIISYNMSSRTVTQIIPQPAAGRYYGLAYDKEADFVYAGYAPDFSSAGRFNVYNIAGILQKSYVIAGGIAPRRIVVKY